MGWCYYILLHIIILSFSSSLLTYIPPPFPSSSSPLPIFSSPLPSFPLLPLPSFLLPTILSILLFHSHPNLSSIHLIQSIRVGIWISLFIFHKNLTPHVLSEWMVEVCGEVCWNPVWMFDVRCYYILYYILYLIIILLYYILNYYYILYYTLLLSFSSPLLLFPIFSSSTFSSSFLSIPHPIFSSSNIQSIRVGTYIYLFIYSSDLSSLLSSPPPLLLFLLFSPSIIPFPIIQQSDHLIQSIRVGTYIYLFIFLYSYLPSHHLISIFPSSFPPPVLLLHIHSKYTCRYLTYTYLYS